MDFQFSGERRWLCLFTQPHRERLAFASLRDEGFEVYLPIWRAAHLELLSRARRVFVPGEDMRARMQAYFPDLPYLVREHWLDPVSPLKRRGRKLTGAFVMVGAIGPHKGSEARASARRVLRRDF